MIFVSFLFAQNIWFELGINVYTIISGPFSSAGIKLEHLIQLTFLVGFFPNENGDRKGTHLELIYTFASLVMGHILPPGISSSSSQKEYLITLLV